MTADDRFEIFIHFIKSFIFQSFSVSRRQA